jgi:ABC-type multidrug transport system fused ATPase/permease subunit
MKGIRFLLKYTKPYALPYTLGIIGMGLVNLVLNVYLAIILGKLTSSMIELDHSLLAGTLYNVLWLLLGGGALIWTSAISLVYSEVKVERDIRSDFFKKVVSIPLRQFEALTSGEILSRFNSDMTEVSQLMKNTLQSLSSVLFYGVGSCITVVLLDWKMGTLIIGLAFFFFILNIPFMKPLKNQSQAVQEGKASFLDAFNQLVTGQRVIRYFNVVDWMMDRILQSSRTLKKAGIRRNTIETTRYSLEYLSFWTILVIVLIGGFRSIREPEYLPTLVALIQMQNGVAFLFSRVSLVYSEMQRRLVGVERVQQILEIKDEPVRYLRENAIRTNAMSSFREEGLCVSGLTFSYAKELPPVLDRLSFFVPEGKTAAFVGPSGSGKSTLFKILLGLYPAESGEIYYRGASLYDTDLHTWREYFAYVPQLPYLFSGSIRDNLLAINPRSGEDNIEEALSLANASEFVQALESGIDSSLLEGGHNLSGGQRQRIVLSRAFLKNAPVLLLDEATSALDTESERTVQEALNRLSRGRTTLVIAHRLSTVRYADIIFYLEKGTITESGSHDTLMKKTDGKYRHMVEIGMLRNDSA